MVRFTKKYIKLNGWKVKLTFGKISYGDVLEVEGKLIDKDKLVLHRLSSLATTFSFNLTKRVDDFKFIEGLIFQIVCVIPLRKIEEDEVLMNTKIWWITPNIPVLLST